MQSSRYVWKERISDCATDEGMIKVDETEQEWICPFCNIQIDLWRLENHIQGKKHKNNKGWHETIVEFERMKAQGKVEPFLIVHDGWIWCALCDKQAGDDHLRSTRHTNAATNYGDDPRKWYYYMNRGMQPPMLASLRDIPPPPKADPAPRPWHQDSLRQHLAIMAPKQPPPPSGPPPSALNEFGLPRGQPPPPPGSPPNRSAALQPDSFPKSGPSEGVMIVEETVMTRVYRSSESSETMLLPSPGLTHPPGLTALPSPSPPPKRSGYGLTQPPPLPTDASCYIPWKAPPLPPPASAPPPVHRVTAPEYFSIADDGPAPPDASGYKSWEPPPLPSVHRAATAQHSSTWEEVPHYGSFQ